MKAVNVRQLKNNPSEVLRMARKQGLRAGPVVKRSAGLWKDRTDLPDFAALRREADRVSTRA